MSFLAQSEIRRMTRDCNQKGGINLAQGLCDTEIPLVVRRAAQDAIEHGPNTYVPRNGIPELRLALAEQIREFRNIEYDSETEIVVTSGASAAFWATCLTLFNPGDEVILFEPYYGYHLSHLLACGVNAKYVELSPPSFQFSEAQLRSQLTSRTRAIVVSTPNNPCGKMFTNDELAMIARVAVSHNLWVVTDEIYEHFTYDGRTHLSPASVSELRSRCVMISGLSKTFSITGWRVGFCAAPPELATRLALTCDLVYICAPAPLQWGVAEGLRQLPKSFYGDLARSHQRKRDSLCAALLSAGLPPVIPEGAYYVMADVSRLPGGTAQARVSSLLDQAGIAAVPGTAFYHHSAGGPGERFARFCFGKTDDVLSEACQRLLQLS